MTRTSSKRQQRDPSTGRMLTLRTPEAQATVERMVAEGAALSEVARAVGVDEATLWRWRQDDPEHDRAMDRARIAWAAHHIDEAVRIADERPAEETALTIARDRLRVDARARAAAWHAERAAQRLSIDVTVRDGGREPSAIEAAAAIASILRAAEERDAAPKLGVEVGEPTTGDE